jgi:hypothetical protein
LHTDILNCWEGQAGPDGKSLQYRYSTAVVCKDGDEIIGAVLLRGNEVYYPYIKPGYDLRQVLRSLTTKAFDHVGYLHANTANEVILETAMTMGEPRVSRNGNELEWK